MNNLQRNKSLIIALQKCVSVCYDCANACLKEQEVQMLTQCIKLDLECAEICQLAASLLAKESEFAEHMLKVCVDACTICATECDKHEHMDHCRKCAQVCRECAEVCGELVQG